MIERQIEELCGEGVSDVLQLSWTENGNIMIALRFRDAHSAAVARHNFLGTKFASSTTQETRLSEPKVTCNAKVPCYSLVTFRAENSRKHLGMELGSKPETARS